MTLYESNREALIKQLLKIVETYNEISDSMFFDISHNIRDRELASLYIQAQTLLLPLLKEHDEWTKKTKAELWEKAKAERVSKE